MKKTTLFLIIALLLSLVGYSKYLKHHGEYQIVNLYAISDNETNSTKYVDDANNEYVSHLEIWSTLFVNAYEKAYYIVEDNKEIVGGPFIKMEDAYNEIENDLVIDKDEVTFKLIDNFIRVLALTFFIFAYAIS
jgi:hypothetical protein